MHSSNSGCGTFPQATYTWCHMLFPTIDPSVASLVARLTAEYGLIEPKDVGIQSVRAVYDGVDSGQVKAAKLADRLEILEPGLWLHIDHAGDRRPGDPGVRPPRL